MKFYLGFACVVCTIGAVLPPFDTLSRINVVLAVFNGLMCLTSNRK